MKRILIAALAFTLATTLAQAQNTPDRKGKPRKEHKMKSPEDRATKVTDWMTKELALTPEQSTKVKVINLKAFLKLKTLKADTTLAKEQRKAQHKAIKPERRTELKAVLTSEQTEKLKASVKAKKELHKERKAAKQKDGKVNVPSKKMVGPSLTDEELDDLLED